MIATSPVLWTVIDNHLINQSKQKVQPMHKNKDKELNKGDSFEKLEHTSHKGSHLMHLDRTAPQPIILL